MTTYIAARLDGPTAVRLGLGGAGLHHVAFTDADLASLSEVERERLARHAVASIHPDHARDALPLTAAPTVDGVIASIRATLAREKATDEKREADRERYVATILALPDSEWIGDDGGGAWFEADGGYSRSREGIRHGKPSVRDLPIGHYLPGERDPRIAARRDAVSQGETFRAACEKWERDFAAWEATVAAWEAESKRVAAVAEADAAAWIQEHGSHRLQAILQLGFLGRSMSVYRDERLAAERPGWEWYEASALVDSDEIRNPSLAACESLMSARMTAAATNLRWDRKHGIAVLVSTFLGEKIIRAAEAEDLAEGDEE